MAEKQEIKLSPQQFSQLYEQQRNQLEQLIEQQRVLQGARTDIRAALATLEELANSKGDTETVFLLGAGVYVDAIVKNHESVKTELGNRVVADIPLARAKKLLEKRKKQIEDNLAKVREQERTLLDSVSQMEMLLSRMQRQAAAQAQAPSRALEESGGTTAVA